MENKRYFTILMETKTYIYFVYLAGCLPASLDAMAFMCAAWVWFAPVVREPRIHMNALNMLLMLMLCRLMLLINKLISSWHSTLGQHVNWSLNGARMARPYVLQNLIASNKYHRRNSVSINWNATKGLHKIVCGLSVQKCPLDQLVWSCWIYE